jgi:hypothetical protein
MPSCRLGEDTAVPGRIKLAGLREIDGCDAMPGNCRTWVTRSHRSRDGETPKSWFVLG